MLFLEHPHLSVVLALLFNASAASSIPFPLDKHPQSDPINLTIPTLETPPVHIQNLTYAPWPAQPYTVKFYSRYGFSELTIARAYEYHGTRSISVPALQDFIEGFRENLERASPIPGFVSRLAKQTFIDIYSYTTWSIEINEGPWGYRTPTAFALVAMDEIARQLGRHGPADVWFCIKEGRVSLSYGLLKIADLGGGLSNGSLADDHSTFQTS